MKERLVATLGNGLCNVVRVGAGSGNKCSINLIKIMLTDQLNFFDFQIRLLFLLFVRSIDLVLKVAGTLTNRDAIEAIDTDVFSYVAAIQEERE